VWVKKKKRKQNMWYAELHRTKTFFKLQGHKRKTKRNGGGAWGGKRKQKEVPKLKKT